MAEPCGNPLSPRPGLDYQRPMGEALINITVPVFNRLDLTRRTLVSVKKHTRTPHVLTVVDNGSGDETREFLVKLKDAGLIDNLILFARNLGVAAAANMGFEIGMRDLYMKLDNDMEVVRPDWLGPIVRQWCDNPSVSLIGPRFPGTAHPFETVRLGGKDVLRALSSLSGAALLVPREVFATLGYFCEDYGLYGEEDADYSHRAKEAGYLLTAFEAAGVVEHLGEWDRAAPAEIERKTAQRRRNTATSGGLGRFQLNCYLYNHRLLPLFMPRQYVPVRVTGDLFEARPDAGYLRRVQFVRECAKLIRALPEALFEKVRDTPEFVARLRDLPGYARLGLAEPGPDDGPIKISG